MTVAFKPADSPIGSRQLMSELDYLYKYDPKRHACLGWFPGAEAGTAVEENHTDDVVDPSQSGLQNHKKL